ncbi:MAG: glycosyltransferase family 4 protein [Ginsengibacter sp.]
MRRLAIITTHPIQYNAPLFALLTARRAIEIKVFYTWGESVIDKKYDPGFGRTVRWDIPVLNGYGFEFLENVAKDKGSHHFNGIDNPSIIEVIKKFNPDGILLYGWAFKSHLKVLRYFAKKVPILFRGDSTLLDEGNLLKGITRSLFLRWIYSHIDFALYVGNNNFNYFRKSGLPAPKLIHAPHAVDNARFALITESCAAYAEDLRKKLKIAGDSFVFLFAGKMEPKKDPVTLLEAFIECNFNNSVHLLMVGNGELDVALRERYRNKAGIHFIDFQNQFLMPAIYEIADVFVLPSTGPGETWGLSVNEAMANGKAIIVSEKCGCAADLVMDGINGHIFKAGDINNLIKVLKNMDEDRVSVQAMKQESKRIIGEFTIEKVAETIERVVNK